MIDFEEHKIEALLISSLPNVRYLTGFTGSNAMVLLMPGSAILITDPRYDIQARTEATGARMPVRVIIAKTKVWQRTAKLIKQKHLKKVGFEKSRLTYAEHAEIAEMLGKGSRLEPVDGLVEQLRIIKTEEEIARIRRSVATNSAAFDTVAKGLKPDVSESEIAAQLDYEMRRHGAQGTAFETIVASGPRTALPHARPTGESTRANALLLIDMGASQDGYMSDMTRMLFFGKPDKKIRSMYKSVLDAQLAAVAEVRDGVSTVQVDRKAREVLKAAGLDKAFVHSTGHGLGLEIHEAPRIGRKEPTKLRDGMVITIEPGAYVEGVGGIRIEDTVLVTKTGSEILTPTPKELMTV